MEMNIWLNPKYLIKMDVLAGKLFCFCWKEEKWKKDMTIEFIFTQI